MASLPRLVSLIFISLAPLAQAQQDAPALDSDAILREITALEDKQKQTIKQARSASENLLRTGANGGPTAVDLYEKAVEATRFEGLKDKVPAFIDWKKKNAELFRSSEFQEALAFHIRYLLLTMARAGAKNGEEFAKPSLDYAAQLREFREKLIKADNTPDLVKELLDKGVNESVLTKWLNLGPWLNAGKDWEMSPGNLAGILEKNVRSVYRTTKNPQLPVTWDFEMQYEADRISTGRLTDAAEKFNTINRPRMQFAKANDTILIGMKNRGTSEILALIRTYPQHPDFGNWVSRLKESLATPKAPETVAPAAPSAEPPAP
jgi:hypothetical protein